MSMQQTTAACKPATEAYHLGQADAVQRIYTPPNCITDASRYDQYVRGWNDGWAESNHVRWWRARPLALAPRGIPPQPAPESAPAPVASPRGPLTVVRVITREFPEGRRYAVARHYALHTVIYDEGDYATDFAAYVAAAAVALALGVRLDAPGEMRSRLVAYWTKRGRQLFFKDQPRSLCANKYERQAYDLAEAEMMAYIDEADSKPGLSDYVPMTVAEGEVAQVAA